MKRRELFGSFLSTLKGEEKKNIKDVSVIRPPYYNDEADFHKSCIECIDKNCATVCEEQIIVIQDDKTPKLDFSKSGCTFCDECANSCPEDVLNIENKKNINVNISIDILKCMSWHNTMCFSCKDPCLDDAIKFLGMFRPEIDNSICTNCGFCISKCPSEAIILNREG